MEEYLEALDIYLSKRNKNKYNPEYNFIEDDMKYIMTYKTSDPSNYIIEITLPKYNFIDKDISELIKQKQSIISQLKNSNTNQSQFKDYQREYSRINELINKLKDFLLTLNNHQEKNIQNDQLSITIDSLQEKLRDIYYKLKDLDPDGLEWKELARQYIVTSDKIKNIRTELYDINLQLNKDNKYIQYEHKNKYIKITDPEHPNCYVIDIPEIRKNYTVDTEPIVNKKNIIKTNNTRQKKIKKKTVRFN